MNSIKGAEPQIKNLIDRMKKNKEEHKNPMKIYSKEEEKNDDRPIPGKLGPPELSKEKKNQMMERMISARQNLQKKKTCVKNQTSGGSHQSGPVSWTVPVPG